MDTEKADLHPTAPKVGVVYGRPGGPWARVTQVHPQNRLIAFQLVGGPHAGQTGTRTLDSFTQKYGTTPSHLNHVQPVVGVRYVHRGTTGAWAGPVVVTGIRGDRVAYARNGIPYTCTTAEFWVSYEPVEVTTEDLLQAARDGLQGTQYTETRPLDTPTVPPSALHPEGRQALRQELTRDDGSPRSFLETSVNPRVALDLIGEIERLESLVVRLVQAEVARHDLRQQALSYVPPRLLEQARAERLVR